MPSAMARWLFPVPGGPSRTTFSRLAMNVVVARWAMRSRVAAGTWSKTKSWIVLTAGKCAAAIRIRVPFAVREATWRPRTAARYSSWDQPASRAWSPRTAKVSVITGVLSSRARNATSPARSLPVVVIARPPDAGS
ncbi:Uncharacterised protein [Mycobacteroides abscessus subsp. abscessus]|nr:Uncharacterised protein [Mycobacteroides abscessus subsp. abscessus]